MNIRDYMGENIPNILPDEDRRELYRANWDQLHINYGDNVEWQRLKKQILLCDETREYLYGMPPAPVRYVKGTRPVLEKYVEEATKDAKTDREKVLSLMCFCRDLYKKHGTSQNFFYGGTEEDLIKKGEHLCECLGRLMVALCEIAGFPGRIVMHMAGHIVSEIYFENRWAYIDPRGGMFYLDGDGKFLSVDEVWRNRDVIGQQTEYVRSFVSDRWTYDERMRRNYWVLFSPGEMHCFCDYSLMEADSYDYHWKSRENVTKDGMNEAVKRYRSVIQKLYPEPPEPRIMPEPKPLDISEYQGIRILSKLADPARREQYYANWQQLRINYGDNVEWQRLRKQILLCDETREYLYGTPPAPVRYVKGTRPVLEKYVEEATKDAKTDREKVLSLMCFCRDLYIPHGSRAQMFFGGTEEELIEKGENLCECLGRLMVALSEIAGFPGRIVMHMVGHITSEIFFEDHWAYIDPRYGSFFVDGTDRMLSVDEIMQNREVILSQPDYVRTYQSARWPYEDKIKGCYNRYFAPGETQCLCEYSLMDADEYSYEWKSDKHLTRDGMEIAILHYRAANEKIYGK